jgi:hypothetical protein
MFGSVAKFDAADQRPRFVRFKRLVELALRVRVQIVATADDLRDGPIPDSQEFGDFFGPIPLGAAALSPDANWPTVRRT